MELNQGPKIGEERSCEEIFVMHTSPAVLCECNCMLNDIVTYVLNYI